MRAMQAAQANQGLRCCALRHAAPRPQRRALRVQAIRIDRRQHLELAWQRQNARDEWWQQLDSQQQLRDKPIEVQDLEQLDKLMEWAGNSLVVVCFFTRSCGACKGLLACFDTLCKEAKSQQVRAVFARHNIINEFDEMSDISRWHKVRLVPSMYFYDQGALVKKVTLRDVRRMGQANKTQIQQAMSDDLSLVKAVFRQMVFERSPGARP